MEIKSYILITGASSGIGQEIAIRLSRENNIILNGRNKSKLQQVISLCDQSNNHLIWEFDLEDVEAIENSLTEFIKINNGTITDFVHAAGYLKILPLKMLTVNHFHTSFNIHVVAAAMISKILMKKKINQDKLRSIVFISSNISNFGAKGFSPYASTKSALDGLMRCLAVELGPAVRVNSVLPGSVKTAMTEHIYNNQELIKRMESAYPLGLGTPENIVDVVLFLISDSARWITGQQLVVDGGRTINITG